ncbi:MAG: ester cyclase, partial [Acidobacteria bacterium]|nr:ester cyclase [Acidobacteriota bacterium]
MSEQNKALVRKFYQEAFEKGNVSALDQLCSKDFIDHSPLPGAAPGLKGMKDMVSMMHGAFGDIKVNIEELVAEGDTVASLFSLT